MGRFRDVRAVAARQHGVVTLAQLRAHGLSARQVSRAVEAGHLHRLHRGLYLLGSVPLPLTAEAAAVLACGARAVLSHGSAAAVHGVLPKRPGPIHVTAGRHRRGDDGIVVHRAASIHTWEVRERHGIRLTAPARTLVDLASTASIDELERAVAEAFASGLTNLAALRRALRAYRGRRGVARLITVLDGGGPRRTRSNPERILLGAIRRAGLPVPETNVRIGRWEVDLLWRDHRLVLEVDAYSTHSSPFAFERDRRKDAELRARGLSVQRFTAERIRSELDAVLAWVSDALRPPPVQ